MLSFDLFTLCISLLGKMNFFFYEINAVNSERERESNTHINLPKSCYFY